MSSVRIIIEVYLADADKERVKTAVTLLGNYLYARKSLEDEVSAIEFAMRLAENERIPIARVAKVLLAKLDTGGGFYWYAPSTEKFLNRLLSLVSKPRHFIGGSQSQGVYTEEEWLWVRRAIEMIVAQRDTRFQERIARLHQMHLDGETCPFHDRQGLVSHCNIGFLARAAEVLKQDPLLPYEELSTLAEYLAADLGFVGNLEIQFLCPDPFPVGTKGNLGLKFVVQNTIDEAKLIAALKPEGIEGRFEVRIACHGLAHASTGRPFFHLRELTMEVDVHAPFAGTKCVHIVVTHRVPNSKIQSLRMQKYVKVE